MPQLSTPHRPGLAAVGLLALPLFAGTALAANGAQTGAPVPANQAMPAPRHVSPVTIDKAGKALRQVLEINRSYGARMSGTTDAARKQQLVAAARDKATAAITREGLSVEQYDAVLAAARRDPAIRAELLGAAGLHTGK